MQSPCLSFLSNWDYRIHGTLHSAHIKHLLACSTLFFSHQNQFLKKSDIKGPGKHIADLALQLCLPPFSDLTVAQQAMNNCFQFLIQVLFLLSRNLLVELLGTAMLWIWYPTTLLLSRVLHWWVGMDAGSPMSCIPLPMHPDIPPPWRHNLESKLL